MDIFIIAWDQITEKLNLLIPSTLGALGVQSANLQFYHSYKLAAKSSKGKLKVGILDL